MAKYTSLIQLHGTISGATFADNNGTPTARMAGGMSSKTWHTSNRMQPARNHAAAFGAASKLASLIRNQLDNDFKRLMGAHTHNRITKAILDAAHREGGICLVPAFPPCLSTAGLRHLDLGHRPKDRTRPLVSTQHHTLTEKVTIHGLQRLRDSIPLKRGELLEYRILTAHVLVPGAIPDPQNPHGSVSEHKSDWTSALRLPETTDIPAPHHDNSILIVGIEWRAIQGRRLRYFPQHNILKVAAAHIGTRPEDLPWLRLEKPKKKHKPKGGRRRVPPHPVSLTPMEAKAARQRYAEAILHLKPPLVLA